MEEDDLQNRRRENLQRWVTEHGGPAALCRGRNLSPSYPSYISQTIGGGSFGARGARNAERNLGMPSGWLDQDHAAQSPKGGPPHGGAHSGVTMAQVLSHVEATIDPPTIEWGDSLPDHLPQQFKMALRDDALAPDYPAGALFIWSTTKPARIGSVVLVCDSYGQQHARRHGQGRAPGQWVAEATGAGFMPFDGAEVTLLAVADWQPMP